VIGASADWSLRLARSEDADHLPAIERAAGQMFRGDPDLAQLDFDDSWEPDELRRLIGRGHSLMAHCGDAPAGFLASQPFKRELHVWELSVHPDHQRRGIGAGLMRACMIDARNSGFAAITLTTFRDIAWNGPFYARLGFEEVREPVTHARLAQQLDEEGQHLPRTRRCAMIRFLN